MSTVLVYSGVQDDPGGSGSGLRELHSETLNQFSICVNPCRYYAYCQDSNIWNVILWIQNTALLLVNLNNLLSLLKHLKKKKKVILSLLEFHPFLPHPISLRMTVQFMGEYSVFILMRQKVSHLCPRLCDTFCYWLIWAAKKSWSDCVWFFLPCWACLERVLTNEG